MSKRPKTTLIEVHRVTPPKRRDGICIDEADLTNDSKEDVRHILQQKLFGLLINRIWRVEESVISIDLSQGSKITRLRVTKEMLYEINRDLTDEHFRWMKRQKK